MSITNDQEVTALRLIIAMIIVDLDKAGILSRTEFATKLRKLAATAEQESLPEARGRSRPDLQICRQLADSIDPPDNNTGMKGWTPVVHHNSDE